MSEAIRKSASVELAQNTPEEKKVEPKKEARKEVPKKELPLWNFPLQGRSVRAKNLAEAEKIINIKK